MKAKKHYSRSALKRTTLLINKEGRGLDDELKQQITDLRVNFFRKAVTSILQRPVCDAAN